MLTSILSFIFVLGLLIFVHELGHFITAKLVGIRVERFSLGFPPRMFGFKYGETDYCISWLPLGGYVKMSGMIDESLDDTIKGEPWEFASKPVWQRSIVISAGSIMNFITAIVIYAGLVYFNGIGEPVGATVGEVLSGKPAETIGLQVGDVITEVDGQPVQTWEDLTHVIHSKPNVEIEIAWRHGDEILSSKVVPELQPENHIGLIGIAPKIEVREAGFVESVKYGASNTYSILKLTVTSLKKIVTGEESFKKSIGGPIVIYKLTSESAKRGIATLMAFTAFISLNLGFFNLLPFPVLDGGHLVLLLLEGIMRKPLPVKTRIVIQKIGMAFLLALMIFILINDLTRFKDLNF